MSFAPIAWQIVGGLQLTVAAVGVLGNTLVGTTLLTNRQLRKNTNNIIMANLAMADCMFATVLFFTGYWNITSPIYPFGDIACRFHMLFLVASSQASNNILAAMAVIKYIHVAYPFTSDTMLRPVVVGAVCATCWLIPMTWNGVISLFSVGIELFLPSICYPVYTVFVSVMNTFCFFLIQFIIIVAATVLLLRIVRRHHKSIGVMTVGVIAGGANNPAPAPTSSTSSWKGVRTFVVVVTAYLIMQSPLYIVTLVQTLCGCIRYDIVFEYVMYPFQANCFVNVCIYFVMEPRFRKGALQLLTGGRYGQSE